MNGTSVSLTEDSSQNVTAAAAALLGRRVEGVVTAKEGVNSVAVVFR